MWRQRCQVRCDVLGGAGLLSVVKIGISTLPSTCDSVFYPMIYSNPSQIAGIDFQKGMHSLKFTSRAGI